ncbi:MAG: LamG domain-containing protein [Planctomycetes bacterium]|nr:LamG domain-containing protein [Planctomycetota bacterium]
MTHPLARICLLGSIIATCATSQQAIQLVTGGTDDHLDFPADSRTIPDREMTVECWMTYDDSTVPTGSSYWPTICRHNVTPGAENYFLRVQAGSTNNLVLTFKIVTGQGGQSVSYNFVPGEFAAWTHVAATYDNRDLTLYINGMPVGTTPASGGNLASTSGFLRVGNGDDSTAGHEVWNGEIDEFRIWPFARTQAEILDTMNASLLVAPSALVLSLDGLYDDFSLGLTPTVSGTVPFVAGNALTPVAIGGVDYGQPSTTCTRHQLGTSVGSTAAPGNADFALICYDARVGRTGGVFLATQPLATPLNFFGVDFWVDVGTLLPAQPPATVGSGGTARRSLPIPAGTPSGLQLHAQFLFLDDCGSMGLVASKGLTFTIQ